MSPAGWWPACSPRTLRRSGVDTFIDNEALKPGCDWTEELGRHAELSEVMVLVLTPTYS